ncbi:MAG TPA: hypothetical protein VFZ34_24135 [Blastocatellia bacterium]|nr:hypothetical protein [Blastocatellia bacterium]
MKAGNRSVDALDRLTQIIQRGNGNISLEAQTHLTVPGQTRSFAYDTWGRTQSETTPKAGTVSYTYSANDQIATTTNANNKITTVAYNTRNLVTGISYNDATPAVSYGYDEYGARTTMTDGEGAMSYTYNAHSQLTSETRSFTESIHIPLQLQSERAIAAGAVRRPELQQDRQLCL